MHIEQVYKDCSGQRGTFNKRGDKASAIQSDITGNVFVCKSKYIRICYKTKVISLVRRSIPIISYL